VSNPNVRIVQKRAPKVPKPTRGLSQCGLDFLKCAFAVPDFDTTGSTGIPDNYVGRTLMSMQSLSRPSNAVAGTDTYVLVSPFFGSAFFSATATIGNQPTGFVSTIWPGYSNLGLNVAPNGTGTVSRFRYAGLAAEIQLTMNEMTWAGSITCFRIPMSMTVNNVIDGSGLPSFEPTGLNNLNVNPFNQLYTSPINKGAYATSFNRTGSFDFRDVVGDNNNPMLSYTYQSGLAGTPSLNMAYRGHDDLDTIVFRISVPDGAATQSYILRTWACVEMQAVPSSFVYEFAQQSCPHDPIALDMYKLIAERLPIAVPYEENADFWRKVLQFVRAASARLSVLPGPVGDLSSGVNLISNTLASLLL